MATRFYAASPQGRENLRILKNQQKPGNRIQSRDKMVVHGFEPFWRICGLGCTRPRNSYHSLDAAICRSYVLEFELEDIARYLESLGL
jgi:hypothetical protein